LITNVHICSSFKTTVSNSCYAEVNEWITVKGKEMKEVGMISINVLGQNLAGGATKNCYIRTVTVLTKIQPDHFMGKSKRHYILSQLSQW